MSQSVFFSNLFTIFFLSFPLITFLQAKNEDFVRSPPGKVVLFPNSRTKSEPQQVNISVNNNVETCP